MHLLCELRTSIHGSADKTGWPDVLCNRLDRIMDKREFLKASGLFITGSLLSRLAPAEQQASHRTNWAGNYEYHTDHLHLPKNTDEVQQVVKSCSKLKALGARHSFNGIADSRDNQISLKQFDGMELDAKASTVTVG